MIVVLLGFKCGGVLCLVGIDVWLARGGRMR